MNDNQPQPSFDIVALRSEMDALKRQRNAAMDDVTVLMGQCDSLRQQLNDINTKLKVVQDKLTVFETSAIKNSDNTATSS